MSGPTPDRVLAINWRLHFDRLIGAVARENWRVAIADRRGFIYRADQWFTELIRFEWPDSPAEHLPVELIKDLLGPGRRAVAARVVVSVAWSMKCCS